MGKKVKHVNQKYKDSLFRMIFSEKKDLLSLYNAVNGTNYEDPEALEINTLKDAVYMKMKNDLSFVIDYHLSVYEHQSTYNPNMPLRYLFYVADLYEKITRDENRYSSKLIRIAAPHFITFYNGIEEQPERRIFQLSDAFERKEENPSLELKVLALNINPGYNEELMSHCKTLRDYMIYVDKVRTYGKEMALEEAVDRAIRECIKDDVLAEFLRSHQSEAMHMSIYEYDEEKHMKQVFEEGRQAGEADGFQKGRQTGEADGIKKGEARGIKTGEARGIKKGEKTGEARMTRLIAALLKDQRQEDLVRITQDKDYLEKLYQEYGLSKEETKQIK